MRAELIGAKKCIMGLKVYNKTRDNEIKKIIAIFMTKTREKARDYLIPNLTNPKTYNPYQAWKQQPSTPGRLTSRTCKLKYMLGYDIHKNDYLYGWDKKWNNILQKEETIGLKGQIREMRKSTELAYIGTYRVFVKEHYILMSTMFGMPQETLKSLAMRFQQEYMGRPIFAPVTSESELVSLLRRSDCVS